MNVEIAGRVGLRQSAGDSVLGTPEGKFSYKEELDNLYGDPSQGLCLVTHVFLPTPPGLFSLYSLVSCLLTASAS